MADSASHVMREVALSAPVKAWLRSRGLKPCAEAPNWEAPIDLVGVSESLIVAVELKMSFTSQALRKAITNQFSANESWVAAPTQPRPQTVTKYERSGIGVLKVSGAEAIVLLAARTNMTEPIGARCNHLREWAADVPDNDDMEAGLPTLAGTGPAQDCERRVEEYRATQPKATWREIFAAVSNHYANPRSMARGIAAVYERRARKEREKEAPRG